MTFVLNQVSTKRVKKPVAEQTLSAGVSFLSYIQLERTNVIQAFQYMETCRSSYTDLEREYELFQGSIDDRLSLKRRVVHMRKQVERISCISPKEFDRKIMPFLDMYYVKNGPTDLTDDDLISMYKQEFFANETTPKLHTINTDYCTHCGTEYVYSAEDAMLYCQQCGDSSQFMDATSSSIAYGDEIEYTSFSYKRINHLNEWLNHFQAKETTPVPDTILIKLMNHLFEKRHTKPGKITYIQIRKSLKQLGMRKYYDQSMQIWCRLTGNKPLRLDPVCEEKIRLMFIRIQKPFDKYCPKNRKNFLSYPYCMYKFCQLLGHQALLPYFSLLKGKDKLQLQEEIFEKICRDLDWKFVPIHMDY
jgi:hypothetical protein